MKKLTLILCFTLWLTGCSSADQQPSTKAAETKRAETSAVKTEIGVAACDEYLSKVEKCMNNQSVPPAVRDSWRQSLDQNRAAWQQAAATPQGKAGLESSCKMALESAKPTFDQFCK